MMPRIHADGTIAIPEGITSVEVEIPELHLTPAQRAHEDAISAAHDAVLRSIGNDELERRVAELYLLIRSRDMQITLALEGARLNRVFDKLRGVHTP